MSRRIFDYLGVRLAVIQGVGLVGVEMQVRERRMAGDKQSCNRPIINLPRRKNIFLA